MAPKHICDKAEIITELKTNMQNMEKNIEAIKTMLWDFIQEAKNIFYRIDLASALEKRVEKLEENNRKLVYIILSTIITWILWYFYFFNK